MTRCVMAALCILWFAGMATADLDGSYVMMSSPTEVLPGETYTFTFWVQNESADGEAISNVHISFPDGYVLFEASMAYDEIESGRPSWDMYIPDIDHTAIWEDNDGGGGEILPSEGTTVSIDATVAAELYGTPIFWCVQGDGAGGNPQDVCGCVQVAVSPVQNESWTAIKSLYR